MHYRSGASLGFNQGCPHVVTLILVAEICPYFSVRSSHQAIFGRLEARLKKTRLDDKSSASESQALSAMVRVLGLEQSGNESGVAAIERALQAAATEREAMKQELEQKREEAELMARRLRDVSQKNAKVRGRPNF